MRKNKGFTLVEVLVTLAIIGVVAAMVAPALNNAVQKSKVGPSLRKFVSTMENANELMMQENEADAISRVALDVEEYLNQLHKYVNGTVERDSSGNIKKLGSYGTFKSYSGTVFPQDASSYGVYILPKGDSIAVKVNGNIDADSIIDGSYKGEYANIIYDINGFENKPNVWGKDVFYFIVDNGGSVVAYGSEASKIYSIKMYDWKTVCPNGKTPGNNSQTCTGSIVENGWKVMYKY